MSKSVSRSAVVGASKSSQAVSDAGHMAMAKKKATAEIDACTIQVIDKLKSLPDFKDEDPKGNLLLEEARNLTTKEKLKIHFSHLMDPLLGAVEEVAEFEERSCNYTHPREREAAEKRVEMRNDHVKLKIKLLLRDVGGKSNKTLDKLGRFMGFEYSGKHAAVLVGNVLLEWGKEDIVIPKQDESLDEDQYLFEGEIEPEYHTDKPISINSEGEFAIHWATAEEKDQVIDAIIDVIIKYNTRYYYNTVSRNCQHFVNDILKAAGIPEPKFSALDEEYLRHIQEGKAVSMPQSFPKHQDIDAFVTKLHKKKKLFELSMKELEHLKAAYDTFHSSTCAEERCQANLVEEALAKKKDKSV